IRGGDIKLGFWSTATNTFTTANDFSQVNAVWVSAKLDQRRGDAVPLMFAPMVGINTCDVTADSIAMLVPPINVDQIVQATADPFLAGMPAGSIASQPNPHHNPDFAGTTSNPLNSPQTVPIPVTTGATYTFDSITGNARHDPDLDFSSPDGDTNDPGDPIGHNDLTTDPGARTSSTMYNSNGIADAWIPINALVGVFLDDKQPDQSPAPANLDFRSDDSRDFTTLQPKLKQLFFIGDGLDSKGNHQQFIAPKGATRLYLATMDYYEWNNNAGFREIKVNRPGQIITVK
ncbi:MAG TPA: TadG family pilus assembly protein, partial [Tepidisphaeraceae bacterium]